MDQADFPWRTLGTLLVEEKLLTTEDLDRALAEQRQTGRLLGQILVDQRSVTAVALARALARQHGVSLGSLSSLEPEPPARRDVITSLEPGPARQRSWRPLGTLLVEQGLLADSALREALAEQRDRPERRLGEILVERGHLSGAALASALADQHGLDVTLPALTGDMETVVVPVAPGQPSYEVCSVADEPANERRTVLYEGPNLLDAADFACEYVDRRQPHAVEIQRRDGKASETVWSYSRERAEAAASASKSLVETFGFDPVRWNAGSTG
jgi:hypothetical protein